MYISIGQKYTKTSYKEDIEDDKEMAEAVNNKSENQIQIKRDSVDTFDSQNYQWHNYYYDQLPSSDDSGCPESSSEEIDN